jgi:hypothetical protein
MIFPSGQADDTVPFNFGAVLTTRRVDPGTSSVSGAFTPEQVWTNPKDVNKMIPVFNGEDRHQRLATHACCDSSSRQLSTYKTSRPFIKIAPWSLRRALPPPFHPAAGPCWWPSASLAGKVPFPSDYRITNLCGCYSPPAMPIFPQRLKTPRQSIICPRTNLLQRPDQVLQHSLLLSKYVGEGGPGDKGVQTFPYAWKRHYRQHWHHFGRLYHYCNLQMRVCNVPVACNACKM